MTTLANYPLRTARLACTKCQLHSELSGEAACPPLFQKQIIILPLARSGRAFDSRGGS
jgi:hypothetical protein